MGEGGDDCNNLVSPEPLENNIPRKLSIRRGHPFKEHNFLKKVSTILCNNRMIKMVKGLE